MGTNYQGQFEGYFTDIEICIEFVGVLFCREKKNVRHAFL